MHRAFYAISTLYSAAFRNLFLISDSAPCVVHLHIILWRQYLELEKHCLHRYNIMERIQESQTGGEPNPVDTTGLCLLSLDGGGVRGLSTLYILKGLMDRLNHERRNSNLPPVKPCEIFDLIGGTSTGG